MSLRRFVILCGMIVAFTATSVSIGPPQFTLARFNALKKSVVRVDASCSGRGRSATGFFWNRQDWVVTALHVVAGCSVVSVYSETAGKTSGARIFRVLRAEDLALLQINTTIDGTRLLPIATRTPGFTEDLETLGYPFGVPKVENTPLRLRYGGRKLRDIVPPGVADELSVIGSPSPDIDVTDILGNLAPGDSGAPILNSSGKVVAIADGGLENGAVGASWGLPASNLGRLPSSTDPTVSGTIRSSHLFAAENDAESGPDISCGGQSFKKIRTLAFGDILHATDDPLGLQQIIATAGQQVSSFDYDVYQNLPTGATFVVPSGSTISSMSGMCDATMPGGNVAIRVMMTITPNDPMGQRASTQYELEMLGTQGWKMDPGWSYWQPFHRFDGLWVRRKSFVHFTFRPVIGWTMDANFFETLAYRNDVFLGVSAINRNWTVNKVQIQQACKNNPLISPYCQQALADFAQWAQAVIAVHLATFPIG